jgi:hypothetical protein
MAAMTKSLRTALLIGVGSLSCLACEPDKDGKPPPVISMGPGAAKCNLNTKNPGPLVRGGTARVKVDGPSISIDAKNVPALCGPIYNMDVPKLNAKAGDGLLLETCLPEGTIQVTSYTRTPGKQPLHGNSEQAGTEVLFNRNEATSYSSRGIPSDSVVLSPDMWKAEIKVELQDVMGSEKLEAEITFDCPHPSPLELKTAAEKAAGATTPSEPAQPAVADQPKDPAPK